MLILVTAGPTREFIDDVRFLSNASSGRMGVACCTDALSRGHEVILVHGPMTVPVPSGVEAVPVTSAMEMAESVWTRLSAVDALIMAAAVSDYRPASRISGKRKKDDDAWSIEMVRNPDILAECGKGVALARDAGEDVPLLVGFALESDGGVEVGEEKRKAKGCDLIAWNRVDSLGSETGSYILVGESGVEKDLPEARKEDVAAAILDWLERS
jgi:phosphopantothenoylcysteine decarboxylase/phosphopantothenate--cysteine ligase